MVPAGAGRAARFTIAWRAAARARVSGSSSPVKRAKGERPPPPALPRPQRVGVRATTEMERRTSGRLSATSSPSLCATTTTWWLAARVATT